MCIDPIGALVMKRAYLVTKVFGPAPANGLVQVCVTTNDPNHEGPPEDFVFDAKGFMELRIDG